MSQDIEELLFVGEKVIENARSAREIFFAGVAFGALGARMSEEEILKVITALDHKGDA